jgi:hypothetical protein
MFLCEILYSNCALQATVEAIAKRRDRKIFFMIVEFNIGEDNKKMQQQCSEQDA